MCVCAIHVLTTTHPHPRLMYVHANSHLYVCPWRMHMCAMTILYIVSVPTACILSVSWLMSMCIMTNSCVCHDSFVCVTWVMYVCVLWLIHVCVSWLIHVCVGSIPPAQMLSVSWLIHMCAKTHSFVYLMTYSCVCWQYIYVFIWCVCMNKHV